MAKQKMRPAGKVFLVFLAVVVILVIVVKIATSGPKPSFTARVTSFEILPGNYVRVNLDITNTGKGAGAPSCVVTVQPTNVYGDSLGSGGFTSIGGTTIQPGRDLLGHVDIVVANNDAKYVTSRSMIMVGAC